MKKEYYKKYELVPEYVESHPEKNKFFGLELDDILILALIFIMLTEEEPDYISIIALGFLFFS